MQDPHDIFAKAGLVPILGSWVASIPDRDLPNCRIMRFPHKVHTNSTIKDTIYFSPNENDLGRGNSYRNGDY